MQCSAVSAVHWLDSVELSVAYCEVTMENAADNQIHLSQSVPMSSPLTWKLTGDIGEKMSGVVL